MSLAPGQLRWSAALATGIPLVDEQHERLLGIFNRAVGAQGAGATREQAASLLQSLFDYAREHFREEARLMRRWRLDAEHRTQHLQAHRSFLAYLEQVEGLALSHPAEFTVDLLAFLAQWLLHHIMGLDARMAREIRGLQGEPTAAGPAAQASDAQQYLVEILGQLTEVLGRRTTDLIEQRQKLLELQDLYRALLRSADVLIESRSEQDMLGSLCDTLTRDTPFHTAWIGRPGPSQDFEVLAVAGSGGQLSRRDPVGPGERSAASIIARAWSDGQVVVCNDALVDCDPRPAQAMAGGRHWAGLLAAPIQRGGASWAILVFATARRAVFDEATVALCTRIASLLGHGLDELDRKSALQQLQDTESRRARSDSLTGLPNRLALDEYLPGALARAGRRQGVVAVGVLDLDDFKPVNDRLGHAMGDVLLRKLGQALRLRLRRGDFVARLGGDELVVVFEDLDARHHVEQLETALGRLHEAVQAPFDLGQGRSAQVGVTMGLALYPMHADQPDTLLRLADAAMYASKLHKHDRVRWWRIGSGGGEARVEEGLRESAVDLFGGESAALLASLDAGMLQQVAEQFTGAFYEALSATAENAGILRCLSADESAALRRAQVEHLRFLLRADTTREALERKARHAGRIHLLVGVSAAAMEESFARYEDLLRAALEDALISSRQRYRVLRVASGRLRLDVQNQLSAIDQTSAMYFALLETMDTAGACWADVLSATLQRLGELPGLRHAILFRPDEQGVLRHEAGAGADYEGLAELLEDESLYVNLEGGPHAQRGPISATWFSHQVEVVDSYALESRLERWRGVATRCGWRSAATVPIISSGNIDSVLVLFGAYPHQFSSKWARSWLELLRGRLDAQFSASARGHAFVEPARVRALRELLYARRLQMWVQPIVDLHSGTTVKLEALARLVDAEDRVLAPASFLPAFGEPELQALFLQGLDLALESLRQWRQAGQDIGISINLAPSTLHHPDCASWIEQALHRAQVAPCHLTLEVLESEDLDQLRSDRALGAIDALGVRLALDDLGAGYGSLRRLAALPIDTVKIDQSLIGELPRDPVKTIRLLAALLRIGQQFAHGTVVEGLEQPGACEAARLLGARLGQGYALARPMPPEAFLDWARSRPIAPSGGVELQSWPGALAYHWEAIHHPPYPRHPGPLGACPLTRFLRAQGCEHAQALRWHAQVHHSAYLQQMDDAAQQLLQWLAQQTLRASAPGAGG